MLFLDERVHIDGGDATEKVNVVVRMELCHLAFRSRFGSLKDVSGDVVYANQELTNISIFL